MEAISLGEGNTPLYRSKTWPNVWIKDERQNPTGTFKDRQAALIVARAQEEGVSEIALASTGNTALAAAAFAAKAGIDLHVFLPERSRQVELGYFDCEVSVVEGTYDETKEEAEQWAEQFGYFYVRGMDYVEAMSPIAHEILSDLGKVPDWYVQAVSGGMGPMGVWRGFQNRESMAPRLLVAQVEGCAPMVRSFEKGLSEIEPVVEPSSFVVTLGSGNPNEAYKFFKRVGASFVAVSDDETWEALSWAARVEGLLMEPAAAVAFAALKKAFERDIISRDELVVINCSGR